MYPNGNFVDGNLNNFVHTSCYDVPWIEVDLGGMTDIYKIVVYNRVDCCQYRIVGTILQLMNEGREMIYVSDPIRTTNQSYTWLPPNRTVFPDQP